MDIDKQNNNNNGGGVTEELEEGEQIFTSDLRKGVLPKKVMKGRGVIDSIERDQRYAGDSGLFESLNQDESLIKPGEPIKSIEGWIVVVTNIHDEAQESDLRDLFCEYGAIRNMHLNYDRRTGFTKGYALIEYEQESEASAAIKESEKIELAGKPLTVDFAFVQSVDTTPTHTIQLRSTRTGGRRSTGGDRDRDRDRDRDSNNFNNNNNNNRSSRNYRGGNSDNRRNRDNKPYVLKVITFNIFHNSRLNKSKNIRFSLFSSSSSLTSSSII
ncbi:RNA recognition motif-containing protein RRM [Heterostelium album PN500]|uniref:RNA recognition motif-containing protein RRM n=1 Tax=Heterostelium pallidum (strain ATCC 26659 / Pp 5 / PN500) TaxID=670386 RepID=D3BQP7_HETP5|nr:RNA recognition motif-containing protein RRM [Heterostelium album PN500]EFA76467.1 RNA recognition motif-containing protein RRM [Heterostelium album PN500]|eukprot:XP_020428599.1 RNA recognition motif-containing protein RRM [Heterostelium album PN500]